MEWIRLDLSDSIFTEVKLSKLFEFLQVVNFGDFIVGGVQNLQLFHGSQLESIKIMQAIITYI